MGQRLSTRASAALGAENSEGSTSDRRRWQPSYESYRYIIVENRLCVGTWVEDFAKTIFVLRRIGR
jgi:hypothetical protein